MSVSELLKQSSLFKDFTPIGLEIVSRIAKPKIVLAGKPLFSEGGTPEALYVVVEGRFHIAVKGTDGKDVPLASLGVGEHLSEMALLSATGKPSPHVCSAIAEVDSKVLEISLADFQRLTKEKPQACVKLLLAISQEFGQKVADSRDALRHLLTRAVGR
jgi:CRP/FNR family cyclic AMP-dependent transcriptional regulator